MKGKGIEDGCVKSRKEKFGTRNEANGPHSGLLNIVAAEDRNVAGTSEVQETLDAFITSKREVRRGRKERRLDEDTTSGHRGKYTGKHSSTLGGMARVRATTRRTWTWTWSVTKAARMWEISRKAHEGGTKLTRKKALLRGKIRS
ncbi:hypothetical protein ERJ75_000297600 [Trypanosoma vivax]|nr:hypothetical protein ERJ75_000297600 [Trypanosoma vivax]